MTRTIYLLGICILLLSACDGKALNSPYPKQDAEEAVLYTSFSLRPKHLDPARSYSSNEVIVTGQIYEPPYQYHYLKRPYELEPLVAADMPKIQYLDKNGNELPATASDDKVAYSLYTIPLKKGIYYQPHPAFVKNDAGQARYHNLTSTQLNEIETLADFEQTDTRELVADDFVYQIKRLADPRVHSPILGLMGEHIVGLTEYAETLRNLARDGQPIRLREHEIAGVKVLDNYHYQIKVQGKYPQLRFWLAMPFFAPMPWEATVFYDQEGLIEKNITLDWFPVGTGPFYMTENDPNRRMILVKNPFYHADFYPTDGMPEDKAAGLLADAGKRLPLLDKIIFSMEKESTSYWGKFMQGYYDVSGIASDSFEQVIQVSDEGEFALSDMIKEKGIQLETAVAASTFYIGFNMLDPVVGGYSEAAQNLRHAIAIAIDQEEYISIFANGRGIPAQGPVPPGLFGYVEGEKGIDPYVYEWKKGQAVRRPIEKAKQLFGYVEGEKGIDPYVYEWKKGQAVRRPIEKAKQLLTKAGYPNGRNAKTGEPLVLYFDVPAAGPDMKAQLDWMRKQFGKLNIQLIIRSTDYNRFQDKMRRGQAQIFQWGWNADYPDPENFLFLLYGPNGKVKYSGENAANYHNKEFDALFEKMRSMPDSTQRQQIIEKMTEIVRRDAPWVWGFHPKQFSLYHAWNYNVKPNLMANNTLKYRRIDPSLRQELRNKWNQPLLWPLLFLALFVVIMVTPAVILYRRKKYQNQ